MCPGIEVAAILKHRPAIDCSVTQLCVALSTLADENANVLITTKHIVFGDISASF